MKQKEIRKKVKRIIKEWRSGKYNSWYANANKKCNHGKDAICIYCAKIPLI